MKQDKEIAGPIIQVKNLVKKFGSFVADDHLTFDVFPGEIFGFLGANGAGNNDCYPYDMRVARTNIRRIESCRI